MEKVDIEIQQESDMDLFLSDESEPEEVMELSLQHQTMQNNKNHDENATSILPPFEIDSVASDLESEIIDNPDIEKIGVIIEDSEDDIANSVSTVQELESKELFILENKVDKNEDFANCRTENSQMKACSLLFDGEDVEIQCTTQMISPQDYSKSQYYNYDIHDDIFTQKVENAEDLNIENHSVNDDGSHNINEINGIRALDCFTENVAETADAIEISSIPEMKSANRPLDTVIENDESELENKFETNAESLENGRQCGESNCGSLANINTDKITNLDEHADNFQIFLKSMDFTQEVSNLDVLPVDDSPIDLDDVKSSSSEPLKAAIRKLENGDFLNHQQVDSDDEIDAIMNNVCFDLENEDKIVLQSRLDTEPIIMSECTVEHNQGPDSGLLIEASTISGKDMYPETEEIVETIEPHFYDRIVTERSNPNSIVEEIEKQVNDDEEISHVSNNNNESLNNIVDISILSASDDIENNNLGLDHDAISTQASSLNQSPKSLECNQISRDDSKNNLDERFGIESVAESTGEQKLNEPEQNDANVIKICGFVLRNGALELPLTPRNNSRIYNIPQKRLSQHPSPCKNIQAEFNSENLNNEMVHFEVSEKHIFRTEIDKSSNPPIEKDDICVSVSENIVSKFAEDIDQNLAKTQSKGGNKEIPIKLLTDCSLSERNRISENISKIQEANDTQTAENVNHSCESNHLSDVMDTNQEGFSIEVHKQKVEKSENEENIDFNPKMNLVGREFEKNETPLNLNTIYSSKKSTSPKLKSSSDKKRKTIRYLSPSLSKLLESQIDLTQKERNVSLQESVSSLEDGNTNEEKAKFFDPIERDVVECENIWPDNINSFESKIKSDQLRPIDKDLNDDGFLCDLENISPPRSFNSMPPEKQQSSKNQEGANLKIPELNTKLNHFNSVSKSLYFVGKSRKVNDPTLSILHSQIDSIVKKKRKTPLKEKKPMEELLFEKYVAQNSIPNGSTTIKICTSKISPKAPDSTLFSQVKLEGISSNSSLENEISTKRIFPQLSSENSKKRQRLTRSPGNSFLIVCEAFIWYGAFATAKTRFVKF
jgi:hypothetical protein